MNYPNAELLAIRKTAGAKKTIGFNDDVIAPFWEADTQLRTAVHQAYAVYLKLCAESPDILGRMRPSSALICRDIS